jgi:molybdopterin/thiamine biosynthesis adenylyltransferase
MSISTVRHDEIFNSRKNNLPITIIGAGAIGSRVFAALVELGLTSINVIDFDKVEEHNLANQIFTRFDVGIPKVRACNLWMQRKLAIAEEQLKDIQFFEENALCDDIEIKGTVFLLVDSIQARKDIFAARLRGNMNVYRVIDVRMAATHGNIFTFTPSIRREYEAWIDTFVDDNEAEMSACGSSLTVGTTASILANLAVWQYMHAVTDPSAGDTAIDVFLKPLCVHTRSLHHDAKETETRTEVQHPLIEHAGESYTSGIA